MLYCVEWMLQYRNFHRAVYLSSGKKHSWMSFRFELNFQVQIFDQRSRDTSNLWRSVSAGHIGPFIAVLAEVFPGSYLASEA